MNTLVLVTHPKNADEMRASVLSFRQNMVEEFALLVITETENAKAVETLLPFETVIPMAELDGRIEALKNGYSRQMAAKLLAVKAITEKEGFAVFIDDDVLAKDKYNAETFTDENGKPVIFYTREKVYPWMFGQRYVFGAECDRRFQLALPYAQSLVSLRALAESNEIVDRSFRYWSTDTGLSEFQIMGEFELRNDHGADTLRRYESSKTHWTFDKGTFQDWQNNRKYMRIYLAETGQIPPSD